MTTLRSSLKEIRLENILRVMEEGPAWEEYDPIDAINTWYGDADRRLTEESGPRTYTQRTKKNDLTSLSDLSSSEDDFKDEHFSILEF